MIIYTIIHILCAACILFVMQKNKGSLTLLDFVLCSLLSTFLMLIYICAKLPNLMGYLDDIIIYKRKTK